MISLRRFQRHGMQHYRLPAVLFVVILAVNVYVFRQDFRSDQPLMRHATPTNEVQATPLPTNLLAPQQIKSLVKAEAPQAAITKIELKNRDEKLVYVVSLGDKAQLVFDAKNGAKLAGATPKKSADKTPVAEDFVPGIDFASAGEKALTQKPGGMISKIELVPVGVDASYSVHFTDGSVVAVPNETTPAAEATSPQQTEANASVSESTAPESTTPAAPPAGNTGNDPASNPAEPRESPGF